MIDPALAVVGSAAVTAAGVFYTQRQTAKATNRASDVAAQKVDAEAYDRAQNLNDRMVTALQNEVDRLQRIQQQEQASNDALAAEVDKLEATIRELKITLQKEQLKNSRLRGEIDALEERVAHLRKILADRGIEEA